MPGSGFDKLARLYRWAEYLSFGPLLHRTRVQYLPAVANAQRVLVVGDGDGRFAVELLRRMPHATVVAMDASAAMLRELATRAKACNVEQRLHTVHGDATCELPAGEFDLVCTHFFLDCLSEDSVAAFAARMRLQHPQARWLVSEFAVPAGRYRWPAWLIVRALYGAFGLLTGLRVQRLPDYAAALRRNGYALQAHQTRALGLLRAELWQPAASGTEVHPTG